MAYVTFFLGIINDEKKITLLEDIADNPGWKDPVADIVARLSGLD